MQGIATEGFGSKRGVLEARIPFPIGVLMRMMVVMGWISPALLALPIPEPGWVVHGEIRGMVESNRPVVLLKAGIGNEAVDVPVTLHVGSGGVHWVGVVPFESRDPGDVPTLGSLPLGLGPAELTWSLQVTGVDLPAAAAGGATTFGPADRGRMDARSVDFAVRASADTFATWSQRIFGRLVALSGDEDGDGRSNDAEFRFGTSPLDPLSVPVNRPPVASLVTNRFHLDEGTPLSVTNEVSDPDGLDQQLVWRTVSAPSGSTLNGTNGVWTWTPSESQGPTTNQVIVAVDDNGVPPLSATNSFVVVVNEVNTAPAFVGLTNATIPELTLYTQTLAGSDADIPVQTLAFRLISGPEGAGVTNGVFGWVPSEEQGPSTNQVFVSVSDGVASVTNGITVIVTEVNSAPTLVGVGEQRLDEQTLLSLSLKATDEDRPTNRLTFALVSGPEGLQVNPPGALSWSPGESQGPSTNTVVVKVTDNGVPPLSATNSFVVVVDEVNRPPSFTGLTNATVPELTFYTQKLNGVDPDIPFKTLDFRLASGPVGSGVTNREFRWMPTEEQGPSTNEVRVFVSDGVVTVTNSFTVIVTEVNTAPVFRDVGTLEVNPGGVLEARLSADDSDIPPQDLLYSLISGPPGLVVLSDGALSWSPLPGSGPSTNGVTIQVTDGMAVVVGEIQVVVTAGSDVRLVVLAGVSEGQIRFAVSGSHRGGVRLEESTDLQEWRLVGRFGSVLEMGEQVFPTTATARFFRLRGE